MEPSQKSFHPSYLRPFPGIMRNTRSFWENTFDSNDTARPSKRSTSAVHHDRRVSRAVTSANATRNITKQQTIAMWFGPPLVRTYIPILACSKVPTFVRLNRDIQDQATTFRLCYGARYSICTLSPRNCAYVRQLQQECLEQRLCSGFVLGTDIDHSFCGMPKSRPEEIKQNKLKGEWTFHFAKTFSGYRSPRCPASLRPHYQESSPHFFLIRTAETNQILSVSTWPRQRLLHNKASRHLRDDTEHKGTQCKHDSRRKIER